MKIASFAKELFNYLKSPLYIEKSPSTLGNRVSEILYGYLACIPLILLSTILIGLVDKFIVKQFFEYSISAHKANTKIALGRYAVLKIVLIAPLLEEIFFRLPLKLRRAGFGLSLALLVYRLTVPHFFSFDLTDSMYYLAAGAALTVFLFFLFVLPTSVIDLIRERYFKHFFYASALMFAFVHITNFGPLNYQLFLFYPLYTLPQFFLGLSIAYIRMKHGFFSGLALHALINSPYAVFG